MNLFFMSMHPSLSRGFSLMLRRLGHAVFTPDFAWAHVIRGSYQNSHPLVLPGCSQVSRAEFEQIPMDIVFLMCREQELGRWWEEVRALQPGAKVVHYSGNDHTGYAPGSVDYLLSADSTTAKECRAPHVLQFFPILPYVDQPKTWSERPIMARPVVGSYVQGLHVHWPTQAKMFVTLAEGLKHHEVELQNLEGKTRHECWEFMLRSLLTVHFKGAEGYGYSVLESMALGVPVITLRKLVEGRTLGRYFLEHGKTGWLVDTPTEALTIIDAMNHNREALRAMGNRAQQRVQNVLDEDAQTHALQVFLWRVQNDRWGDD